MPTRTKIVLFDVASSANCTAEFWDSILERHLRDLEGAWSNSLRQLRATSSYVRQESSHWNWRAKVDSIRGQLGNKSFAIECENHTQGVMIVSLLSSCRLPAVKGKPLVYVDYLETAPWNRPSLGVVRFRGVGTLMLSAAIQLSRKEGFGGRIGLHSLPQSEEWYSKRGMMNLGPDKRYQNLSYFEMSESQASTFSPEE